MILKLSTQSWPRDASIVTSTCFLSPPLDTQCDLVTTKGKSRSGVAKSSVRLRRLACLLLDRPLARILTNALAVEVDGDAEHSDKRSEASISAK